MNNEIKNIQKKYEITGSVQDLTYLEAIAAEALQEAKRKGASQAEVSISTNKGFSVSVHEGDVETVEYNVDKGIEINVYFGKRSGSASITDIRPDAVKAAVEAACHIAKFTDEDLAAGLAEKEEQAFDYPTLDLFYPWSLSVEEAIEMAVRCEREALTYDKRILNAESASVGTQEAFYLQANSNGFIGHYSFTRHEISCILIAKQDEEMQRDYSYTLAADPALLDPVSHIAKEAAERTTRRLGARRLPTRKSPVIYVADEARLLWGHCIAAISGSNLYRKSTFLLDHLDKKIFPDFVMMQEQPHLKRGLGSAPFDGDGVATKDNIFIENGILSQYILDVYSARKLGMKTTGNAGGVHNLTLSVGNKDLPALIKEMDTGLLITEMMGNGVNLVTGDYSRGAGGFWVEKGEIQYPVQEITVAGKLQDIYAHILAIGNDVDMRGNVRTGSVLIEEMMIAGH